MLLTLCLTCQKIQIKRDHKVHVRIRASAELQCERIGAQILYSGVFVLEDVQMLRFPYLHPQEIPSDDEE